CAGAAGGGVLMAWLTRGAAAKSAAAGEVLRACAVRMVFGGTVAAVAAGVFAWAAQPAEVRAVCSSADPVWAVAFGAWFLGAVGVAVTAVRLGNCDCRKRLAAPAAFFGVQTGGFVVCRDLVRDASLARFGFDVWDRAVVVNWSVLGLFFVLFVAGLGVIGWLAWVAYGSEPLGAKGEAV
ncbi:MAG: hypothetical protein J0I06_28695, partial [Planctomycetes bacterium]|nr:hypothetical protein [Planctomycetota bacterium]